MSYCGYVTTLKNVRPHPNADRLMLADCFGNTICVGLDAAEGEIGIYFPTDGQLSVEFCEQNNLVRKKDDAGNNIGGYLDPDKRNIRAIKLRGEKSDGLFCGLSAVAYTGINLDDLNIGDTITILNGHEICKKYIPRGKSHRSAEGGNRTRKKKANVAPLFVEHADTEQLAYNLGAFKPGNEIEITLKMHGTSQRTGYLPVLNGYWFDSVLYKRIANITEGKTLGKMAQKLHDLAWAHAEPLYEWGYVSGTRRTVLENYEGGYYGSNEFRETHSKIFEGKLWKGETVYYEVVGFTTDGAPIMASCDNKKLNDKEFVKQYGTTTTFSYGCEPNPETWVPHDHCEQEPKKPQSKLYVYRMTMTNEDGQVVEYTPDFMRYRCEMMGVETVPVFATMTLSATGADVHHSNGNYTIVSDPNGDYGEMVKQVAEQYFDGPDPIGKTHVREGVVVRIVNRPKFTAYKHKNWYFKALEGIVKVDAEIPDMEEAQDLPET